MKGFLCIHSALEVEALRALLKKLEEPAYVVQETQVRIRFIRLDEMDALWDEGRAFSETVEVRWRLRARGEESNTLYHVQVLSEQSQSLGEAWRITPMDVSQEARIWLWGRHWHWLKGVGKAARSKLPNAWTEAQIPGHDTLSYPHEPAEFLYLRTVDYSRDGVTLLTRFKGLGAENRTKQEDES